MNQNNTVEQHTAGKSVLLHLLPGFLIGLCYFALVPVTGQLGYPSMAALMISVVVVLVPFELGYLFYQGRKATGRFSLQSVIAYRNRLPVWQYLLWVPVLFVLLGIIFTLMRPVDAFLRNTLFSWIPPLNGGFDGNYSQQVLIVTYALVGIFGVIVGPTVEELYFRGHLLPRMGYAGKWSPLLHSFLFALYHMWTPWMIVTRTIGTLPLVWAAKQRSLYLSIAVHIAINTVDLITAIVFIAAMSSTS
jgi:membrane protease YdiL (CAAX protease family)